MTPATTVVVKVGGEVVDGPHLGAVAGDVAALRESGTPVVMVHGGGPQATDLQKKLGQTPQVVGGRRITDRAALDVMKMVVAGRLNVDLCAALLAAGASPVGLHGASACVIEATKRPPRVVSGGGPDPIDFGHVGDVTAVNGALLALLLDAGHTPVLACLGANRAGDTFNINADIVANQVALAVDARALVLVSDVPGVLRDVKDPSSRIARLDVAEGRRAIAEGAITGGMIPKLEETFAAIAAGLRAVHIVGKLAPGDLIGEVRDPGTRGTVVVP